MLLPYWISYIDQIQLAIIPLRIFYAMQICFCPVFWVKFQQPVLSRIEYFCKPFCSLCVFVLQLTTVFSLCVLYIQILIKCSNISCTTYTNTGVQGHKAYPLGPQLRGGIFYFTIEFNLKAACAQPVFLCGNMAAGRNDLWKFTSALVSLFYSRANVSFPFNFFIA